MLFDNSYRNRAEDNIKLIRKEGHWTAIGTPCGHREPCQYHPIAGREPKSGEESDGCSLLPTKFES